MVNVSPAAENVPETKCSLEFASRARKVRRRGQGRGSGTGLRQGWEKGEEGEMTEAGQGQGRAGGETRAGGWW